MVSIDNRRVQRRCGPVAGIAVLRRDVAVEETHAPRAGIALPLLLRIALLRSALLLRVLLGRDFPGLLRTRRCAHSEEQSSRQKNRCQISEIAFHGLPPAFARA